MSEAVNEAIVKRDADAIRDGYVGTEDVRQYLLEATARGFDEGYRRGFEVGHRIGHGEACAAAAGRIADLGLDCLCSWKPLDLSAEAQERYLELVLDFEYARKELEERHGVVWDEAQLREVFRINGYMLPFVIVQRRSDNVRGAVLCKRIEGRYYHGDLYYEWKAD